MSDIDRAFQPLARVIGGFQRLPEVPPLPRQPPVTMIDGRYATISQLTGLYVDGESRYRLGRAFARDLKTARITTPGQTDDDNIVDLYYTNWEYPDLFREASAFYVTPDMCELVEHGADRLPNPHTLYPEQVPTQLGVVVLGTPFELVREDGSESGIFDVVYWHLLPAGVIVFWTRDTLLRDGHHYVNHYFNLTIPFGHPGLWEGDGGPVRWLIAFWLFVVQKVPALERRQARRQTRRNALADAPTLHTTTFCVLRRRHTHSEDPELTDVDWTHRWIVSGHWRNQYYPSTGEHSPVWIAPYVKGPEDLPLVPKDRAFVVSR